MIYHPPLLGSISSGVRRFSALLLALFRSLTGTSPLPTSPITATVLFKPRLSGFLHGLRVIHRTCADALVTLPLWPTVK